ncbi:peptidase S8, partial [Mesorhizobium sp. M2D.F.Ca.ET.223.01.1.1]
MAAKAVILKAALLAAAFVAAPAFAQTNDPNLTQKQVDCLNRTTVAGAGCDKDGGAKNNGGVPGNGTAAGGAVFLPALIVDLFPNPPASATPQTPAPSGGTS